MKEKTTFGNVQTMNKAAVIRRLAVLAAVVALVIAATMAVQSYMSRKNRVEKEAKAATPAMVPSTIKYYNVAEESSYETASNYIILSENGRRIMIDSDGNVTYVTADNRPLSTLSGTDREAALENAVKIMNADAQANLALYGLDSLMEKEREAAESEEADEAPVVTRDERFDALCRGMGLDPEAVRAAVGNAGSTMEEVYMLMDMTGNAEGVIRSIMNADADREAAAKKNAEQGEKTIAVEVSALGGESAKAEGSSTGNDYPEWLQYNDTATDELTVALNNLASAATGGTAVLSDYEKANNQEGKLGFLSGRQSGDFGASKITKYDLVAGTIIPITLQTGLNTDLPGQVIGRVRQDVYDTLTGRQVLIPKGSLVMADYNSSVTFGQTSVQIAWNCLITPDGWQYSLPGFQGVSAEGYTGVSDKTKTHFWSILGGAVLGSIIDYGATALGSQADAAAAALPVAGLLAAGADVTISTASSIGKKYTDQWMNRQPTIIIRPGAQIQMMVNQTLNFKH